MSWKIVPAILAPKPCLEFRQRARMILHGPVPHIWELPQSKSHNSRQPHQIDSTLQGCHTVKRDSIRGKEPTEHGVPHLAGEKMPADEEGIMESERGLNGGETRKRA